MRTYGIQTQVFGSPKELMTRTVFPGLLRVSRIGLNSLLNSLTTENISDQHMYYVISLINSAESIRRIKSRIECQHHGVLLFVNTESWFSGCISSAV